MVIERLTIPRALHIDDELLGQSRFRSHSEGDDAIGHEHGFINVVRDHDDRALIFCDEARTAPPLPEALAKTSRGTPTALLIGPEGGFSPDEATRLRDHPCALPVSLGPRILRADTAAVAALALVQIALGDWAA